jgi:hypothetical protein
VYPLVEWGVDKTEVNDFWDEQPFTLNLQEHQGNCQWCFKKSFKKHGLLVKETPEVYDFPRRMELEYGLAGPGEKTTGRVFFRGQRSTDQLMAYVRTLDPVPVIQRPDEDSGCTESCEPFTSEDM